MSIRKTKKILKRVFKSAINKLVVVDYAFYCSKEFSSKIKTYKGHPVYYTGLVMNGLIYFAPNVMYKDLTN